VVVYNISFISTSTTTPVQLRYYSLLVIKPQMHQRLADPLLQSSVIICNNHTFR